MTENELLGALRKDFAEVRRDVNSLGREVSGMSGKLDSVCASVQAHGDAIRQLEIADATGSIEIQSPPPKNSRPPLASLMMLPLIMRVLPWVIAVLIGIGAYLGSGGDSEAMTSAIRAVNEIQTQNSEKIERIENMVEETEAYHGK